MDRDMVARKELFGMGGGRSCMVVGRESLWLEGVVVGTEFGVGKGLVLDRMEEEKKVTQCSCRK
jgi:hypothetical protein